MIKRFLNVQVIVVFILSILVADWKGLISYRSNLKNKRTPLKIISTCQFS